MNPMCTKCLNRLIEVDNNIKEVFDVPHGCNYYCAHCHIFTMTVSNIKNILPLSIDPFLILFNQPFENKHKTNPNTQ